MPSRTAARPISLPASPSYRAPEDRLDAEGDLYALATVLYQLLTGVHPRSQSQGVGLPLPSTLATGVPEALDKLLIRCLHPRRELRYASAEEIGRELKDMIRCLLRVSLTLPSRVVDWVDAPRRRPPPAFSRGALSARSARAGRPWRLHDGHRRRGFRGRARLLPPWSSGRRAQLLS